MSGAAVSNIDMPQNLGRFKYEVAMIASEDTQISTFSPSIVRQLPPTIFRYRR
jgi:hypothetical protein